MGTVETFDHTADVGLRVTAVDLDDLFRTAAEGVFDYVVANREAVRTSERDVIVLEAEGPDDLLLAWLNELIFRSETSHHLYTTFDVRVTDQGRRLIAEIQGEPIDRIRHELDHEVKAVTRHGLTVARVPEGWRAELILDI
ncbi:MAG: archease [Isosphaeraceae bacterium]